VNPDFHIPSFSKYLLLFIRRYLFLSISRQNNLTCLHLSNAVHEVAHAVHKIANAVLPLTNAVHKIAHAAHTFNFALHSFAYAVLPMASAVLPMTNTGLPKAISIHSGSDLKSHSE
jgi:fumarate reductase subunit D